jgi:RecA DNA recombination protein
MAPAVARAALESLLRTRKLDTTLTTALPPEGPDRIDRAVPIGCEALDRSLGGGIARGQISEITGLASTGRTALAQALLAGATARGELAACIDPLDRFDVASAISAGIVLERLLWVRGEDVTSTQPALDPAWEPGRARPGQRRQTPTGRAVSRALKATSLVLSAGGFGVVVLDLADIPRRVLGTLPFTTWLRLQRLIASSDTACVVIADLPLARSAGGATVRLEPRTRGLSPITPAAWGLSPTAAAPRFRDQVLASRHPYVASRTAVSSCGPEGPPPQGPRPQNARSVWTGDLPASRRFRGLSVDAHVQSGLRTATCPIDLGAAAGVVECLPASV